MDPKFCFNCGKAILPHYKYCAFCGAKLDFSAIGEKRRRKRRRNARSRPQVAVLPGKEPIDYVDVFQKMEATLKRESSLSGPEFENYWGEFKNHHYRKYSDAETYWKLAQVVFYSGMKAATVSAKLPFIRKHLYDYRAVKDYSKRKIEILADPNVIGYRRKIEGCVKNAKIFDEVIKKHGSFANYIESFGDISDESTLEAIRQDLKQFDYLGPVTALHMMLDLGLNVWKPDRVICRILYRLGQLDHPDDTERAIKVGRDVAYQVGLPIRYIDIIFVKYGQQGEERGFGLKDGICLERNPRCSVCGIDEYCSYRLSVR